MNGKMARVDQIILRMAKTGKASYRDLDLVIECVGPCQLGVSPA